VSPINSVISRALPRHACSAFHLLSFFSSIEECAYVFWTAATATKALAEVVEPFEVEASPTFSGDSSASCISILFRRPLLHCVLYFVALNPCQTCTPQSTTLTCHWGAWMIWRSGLGACGAGGRSGCTVLKARLPWLRLTAVALMMSRRLCLGLSSATRQRAAVSWSSCARSRRWQSLVCVLL
jgi:hypothetical protein